MKRCVDLMLGIGGILILFLPFCVLAVLIKFTSRGPVLHWSVRMGKENRPFSMPKLRTMRLETPLVATDQLIEATQYLTPVGGFLRKSSLDELPQLWSIILGHMSVVGPRPALFNETVLIEMRTAVGVHMVRPGLTGWAQVNGRDELGLLEKVRFDCVYVNQHSLVFDVKVILLTLLKVIRGHGVLH